MGDLPSWLWASVQLLGEIVAVGALHTDEEESGSSGVPELPRPRVKSPSRISPTPGDGLEKPLRCCSNKNSNQRPSLDTCPGIGPLIAYLYCWVVCQEVTMKFGNLLLCAIFLIGVSISASAQVDRVVAEARGIT